MICEAKEGLEVGGDIGVGVVGVGIHARCLFGTGTEEVESGGGCVSGRVDAARVCTTVAIAID